MERVQASRRLADALPLVIARTHGDELERLAQRVVHVERPSVFVHAASVVGRVISFDRAKLRTMTHAIDVVQAFWSALYARDWDAIPTFFTDDSIYFDVPTGGMSAARGGDRIVARLRLGLEPLSEYRHHLRTIAEADGVVFTEHLEEWHFHTGEVVRLPFVSVQHVDSDHISLWKDYWDFATLMNGAPAWWHERLATADLWWVSEVPPL